MTQPAPGTTDRPDGTVYFYAQVSASQDDTGLWTSHAPQFGETGAAVTRAQAQEKLIERIRAAVAAQGGKQAKSAFLKAKRVEHHFDKGDGATVHHMIIEVQVKWPPGENPEETAEGDTPRENWAG